MTSQRIAQSDRQQKSDKPQESGILQHAAVRSVSDVGMQSTDNKEVQPLSNSAFSKDFSRVPISTTKPQQIMAKLTIGAVGDKYEQEADRVAAQVVQRINAPPVQSGEDETVQREEMETKDNEARLIRLPILQRRSSDGGMAATPDLESSINRARGGGRLMENNVRKAMEQGFGVDFSGVKIHTDTQSDQLNRSIQARAFTTGQNVFFGQGEYNPGSRGGQELLAHELTHVVQQSRGQIIQRGNSSSKEPEQRKVEEIELGEIPARMATCELLGNMHEGGKSYASVVAKAEHLQETDRVVYEIAWGAAVAPVGHEGLNVQQGRASGFVVDKSQKGEAIGERQESYKKEGNERVFEFNDGIEWPTELRGGSWRFRLRVVNGAGTQVASSNVVIVDWDKPTR